MVVEQRIKEEPFRLNQSNPNLTVADGVASTWSDIWDYQVPQGESLVLKPNHTFAAYLEDASPAEATGSKCTVKIEKRDASGGDKLQVFMDLYTPIKEFQEHIKMARLMVSDAGVIISERERLVISVYDDAVIDESDSYFELHISRVRKTLNT